MWELIQANKRRSVVLFISLGAMLLLLGYFIGSAYIPDGGGILGLFFFIWALVAGVRLGFEVIKRPLSNFCQAYAYGVLAGFLALIPASFLFAEWLLPYIYNLGFSGFTNTVFSWLLLGTLVGLGKNPKEEIKK